MYIYIHIYTPQWGLYGQVPIDDALLKQEKLALAEKASGCYGDDIGVI